MKKCNHCKTNLLDDARFCHSCGFKVISPTLNCPDCNAKNPSTNKFCTTCGNSFIQKSKGKLHYEAQFPLDFKETSSLAPDLREYFFQAFRERITEEHDMKKYNSYLERFYNSDFEKRLDLRVNQLAEEAYMIHAKQNGQMQRQVDMMLSKNFNSLLDHFIILYCKNLNDVYFPEEILAYHDVKVGQFNLQKMILAFLDLDKEKETYFTDFILMPVNKLKNASQAFLFPDIDEKIMLIADQTIFGSCKEGFALTEKGLYWKAHFEKAKKVYYPELFALKKEKDWITINGNFFNVSPSVNVKMLKLLKKLAEIY